MEQMKLLIEKAKSDEALMAKLDALGAKGAGAEEIVALAAEYGFTITKEGYESELASARAPKTEELSEEDLEAVAGGRDTQNRFDAAVCKNIIEVQYRCVGFLEMVWCDHYRRESAGHNKLRHTCVMGRFDYEQGVHWGGSK